VTSPSSPPSTRRAYIDWLRGVAVLVMIEWHSVDSWTVLQGRDSPTFGALVWIGGWAAPLFLFLAGIAVPFAGASHMARGRSRSEARRAVERRGWQIFLLAHVFHLQSFLFNTQARWSIILKPDILNILGLGLVAVAICWRRATSPRAAAIWLLAPAAAVVLLTPFSRTWWWPTLLYPRVEAYIRPVGNLGVFSLFPWLAYLFAGGWIGRWLQTPRGDRDEARFQRRLGLAGFAMGLIGMLASRIPVPLANNAVVSTSVVFLGRCGLMMLGLSLAWLWTRRPTAGHWSPMVLFGRTSLFVYWVHVEIAYGALSYPLHHALTVAQWTVAFVMLTLVMLGLALLWTRRPRGPIVPPHMVAAPGA
jgi:uncharacterized membrane protein